MAFTAGVGSALLGMTMLIAFLNSAEAMEGPGTPYVFARLSQISLAVFSVFIWEAID